MSTRTTALSFSAVALFALMGQSACPTTTPVMCQYNVTAETLTCDDSMAPISIESSDSSHGVLGVDMGAYQCATFTVTLRGATGWSFHVANSPSNDGYGGDSSDFQNDSEAYILGTGFSVVESDVGGSAVVLTEALAINPELDTAIIKVCDGEISFQSDTTAAPVVYQSNTIFQIDGDEADNQAGINDTMLWLGLNQVVAGSGRVGTGTYYVDIELN